jgi:hypothetical protein
LAFLLAKLFKKGNEMKALAEGEIMMDPWIGAKGE